MYYGTANSLLFCQPVVKTKLEEAVGRPYENE